MKKLPKRTKLFYENFVSNANKQIPHPLDMKLFYWFIHATHQGRTKLSPSELKELLSSDGFTEELASDLASIYDHGRNLLASKVKFGNIHKDNGA